MKLRKIKLTPPIHAISVVLGVAFACSAAEYHVTDTVSFTNAMQNVGHNGTIYLAENIYDISGVTNKSSTGSHYYDKRVHLRGEPGTRREKIVIKSGNKRHFGGNKSFVELTGLTLEGPDSGFGGGIAYDNTDATGVALTNCIFRNMSSSGDYAVLSLNTRGSEYVTEPRFVHKCVFANNTAGRYYGVGRAPQTTFTDCIFTNNSSVSDYGVLMGGKLFKDCTFVDNRAGGRTAVFVYCYAGLESAVFDHCQFERNYAETGPAMFYWDLNNARSLIVTNCTFRENSCKGRLLVTPGNSSDIRFVDTTFVGNVSTNELLFNGPGSFTRCTISNNDCGGGSMMNYVTLADCLLVSNSAVRANNNSAFLASATVRNCTLVSNVLKGGSYRGILNAASVAVNTVFIDNEPNIYRNTGDPNGSKFLMTNCVWNVQSLTNATMTAWLAECSVNGRLVAEPKMKFSPEMPYLPLYGSPLRDKGYSDEAYRSAVGEKDLAGNARYMFKGIDVGCYECQKMPGLMLLVR